MSKSLCDAICLEPRSTWDAFGRRIVHADAAADPDPDSDSDSDSSDEWMERELQFTLEVDQFGWNMY